MEQLHSTRQADDEYDDDDKTSSKGIRYRYRCIQIQVSFRYELFDLEFQNNATR